MRVWTVLLGLVLLMTACTSEPTPPPPAPVSHPPAPRHADRDEKAVLDTLVGLNPCSLVSDGNRTQSSPHLCIVRPADHTRVQVGFTDRATHAERWGWPAKDIGGAEVDMITSYRELCTAEVPVSFRYAVKVTVLQFRSASECHKLRDHYTAEVVAGLGALGKARYPADRPDLSKDTCTVLAGAFTDLGRTTKPDVTRTRVTIDDCYLDSGPIKGVSLGLGVQPGPDDSWGKLWATVSGKKIRRDDHCRYTWSEGAFAGDDNRFVSLDLGECAAGDLPKRLIAAVIARLARPQPPVTLTRLTYRPDEPDDPSPGACADLAAEACEPYQPTPVPGQATDAAKADPHVTCATAVDAVHGQFPDLRPVAVPGTYPSCAFVEPTHALQVDLRILPEGQDPVAQPSSSRPVRIAGHDGVVREYPARDSRPAAASVCLTTGQDSWCLTATFRAPRNVPDAAVDTSGGAKLEPVMTVIATKYLA